ncbi:PF13274 family protein [Leptospira wolbachii serovar Codice str. CDC]|uniref:PF13274 family protein n=1 Tax=Leptospira wolbachii serovar Codice str. CDC TaxID=1218599 RepID=R9ADY1_9LEPT|nr:type II toxin-antitoxin system antitoxin SocA domain-containing protein [Leptospira wolbachii]EOQ98300.1 PF13274 family protein [Leptospira wolbachii serovar Codice str. CDC]
MNKKTENAISFLASKHHENTNRYLSQTFLYKLLAFFDFESLKLNGIPSLSLDYKAMKRGPVPYEIYSEFQKINTFETFTVEDETFNGNIIKLIKSKNNFDLDYFSQIEVNLMRNLIHKYSKEYINANDMSEKSHEDILSWRKAYYERGENQLMKFEEEFESDDDLLNKADNFLIYKELKNIY